MQGVIVSFFTLFAIRLADTSFSTLRFLTTMRGKRPLTWVFGFASSFIYLVGVRSVLTNMNDPGKMLGYAAGYATGVLVGMWVEDRLALGYIQYKIISPGNGPLLTERLRQAGFGVTEAPGRGRDSSVAVLFCSLPRRNAPELENLALDTDPEAFITAQEVKPIKAGFWF